MHGTHENDTRRTINDLSQADRENLVKPIAEQLLRTDVLLSLQEIQSLLSTGNIEVLYFYIASKYHIHEFWNREYIEAFASYLLSRVRELSMPPNLSATVLEVGAGDGRLTHFLNQAAIPQSVGFINFVATDDASYNIKPAGQVEKLDYKDALDKYSPYIVICSWMDPKLDMTPDFRASKNLQEYILIGEEGTGVPSAYYDHPGFEMIRMNDLSQYQLCKMDNPKDSHRHSQTISYRKIKK